MTTSKRGLTVRAVLNVAFGCALVALCGCKAASGDSKPSTTAGSAAAKVAPAPANVGHSIVGTWTCLWNNPRGGGRETRVYMVDGDKVRAVVNGRADKVQGYSSSMKGTITGRNLSMIETTSDGKSWEKLALSEDGTMLTGSSGDVGYGAWNEIVCTR
jgi:hypothetical protein